MQASHSGSKPSFVDITAAFFLLVACFASTSAQGQATPEAPLSADSKSNSEEADLLERDAILIEVQKNQFLAKVDLGEIPRGRIQEVRLWLVNTSSSSSVVLKKASGSCDCVSVGVSASEIAPGERVLALVKLRVQESHRSTGWTQTISFQPQSNEGCDVRIDLSADVAGVLAFAEEQFTEFVGENSSSDALSTDRTVRQVSLVTTPPVQVKNLQIEGPSILNLADIQLVPGGKTGVALAISVDPKDVPESGLVLPISVVDRTTRRGARLVGTFLRRPPISVTPSTLRLAPSAEGQLSGNAMIIKNKVPAADERSSELFVVASLGGSKLNVRQTKLNGRAARITLTVPEQVAERIRRKRETETQAESRPQPLFVDWQIQWGSVQASSRSRCVLLR